MYHVKTSIKLCIKHQKNYFRYYYQQKLTNKKPPWNILFFGTDEFSLPSLKKLCLEYKKGELISNLEVVTSLKVHKNNVEKFSIKENLKLHNWLVNAAECKRFHIGLVVSFGHLIPENIIDCFDFGMLNVHASLLPRWRGAAPIVYAIANGDERTGITIMKIKPNKFDVGEIISSQSVEIPYTLKMPDLYVTLANLGAQMLIETLLEMPNNLKTAIPQSVNGMTLAPKVTAEMAQVNWKKQTAWNIYNLSRALFGLYNLTTTFNGVPIKLYNITEKNYRILSLNDEDVAPGLVIYCKHNKLLQIQCGDGNWVNVEKVGVTGKKIMTSTDFYNGFLSKYSKTERIFK